MTVTGMPCRHAVAAIWFMATNGQRVGALESLFDPVYSIGRWKEVYAFKINPINGKALWLKSEVPIKITPPKHHKQVGRPKKVRNRSAVEMEDEGSSKKKGRLSKKNMKGVCGKCGNTRHNRRTCKGQGEKRKD
ncbi:putative transcription factor interactor and regulator CCHC(Zn) family [Helianthus debilis subsp. tardiflorus]